MNVPNQHWVNHLVITEKVNFIMKQHKGETASYIMRSQ